MFLSQSPLTSTVGSPMGKTNAKGKIGETMILADLQHHGHGIAIPFGHDLPLDLIVVRKEDDALEQYTTSDGRVVTAKVLSTSAWVDQTGPDGQPSGEGCPNRGRLHRAHGQSGGSSLTSPSDPPAFTIGPTAGVAQW